MEIIIQLFKEKNEPLYLFGWVCLLLALCCAVMLLMPGEKIMGVHAYLKPFKFFVSTWILAWSLMLYLPLLYEQGYVKWYVWLSIIALSFELTVITGQAMRGQQSHFNTTSAFDAALFSAMGTVIVMFTLHTAFIGWLFFAQSSFAVPEALVWGIRLSVVLFVIFALEGGVMGSMMRHTVGAADGGAGLPVVNWSKNHGDLRVAHFFGMHALQIIPLFALLFQRFSWPVWLFAMIYFLIVTTLYIQALRGMPIHDVGGFFTKTAIAHRPR